MLKLIKTINKAMLFLAALGLGYIWMIMQASGLASQGEIPDLILDTGNQVVEPLEDAGSSSNDQPTNSDQTDNDQEIAQPNNLTALKFRFVAEKCDSLTKLVRRSILVYDQQNEELELSKPGIIYAETNIVQEMGAYLLDIGDEVAIDGQLVAEYAQRSLQLTNRQVDAWSVYVPRVDFQIVDIQQPQNRQQVEDVLGGHTNDQDQNGDTDHDNQDGEDQETSAVWWFVGIGSAAAVWYLLWRREES